VPVPHWVLGLEDYWRWLDGLIEASGGYLDRPALDVRPIEATEGQWTGLAVEKQRLQFHDGTFVDITLVIDEDFVPEEYNFHFAAEDVPLIWRKDKHEGHEDQHGRQEHVHIEDEAKEPDPFHEVDLEEALSEIRSWQDDRKMP
jgi:hypothetical protein